MIGPLRSELLKLVTTRAVPGLVLAALALVALTTAVPVVLAGTDAAPELSLYDEPTQRSLFVGASAAVLFATIVGVLSFTSEFRHGSIRPTLVFVPQRVRVVIAKLVAAMLAGAVVGAAGVAVAFGIALVGLEAKGYPRWIETRELVAIALGVVAAATLWAAIGVALGALVRNQVAAVVGVVLWSVVESVLIAIVPQVGRLSPGEAANALAGSEGELLSPLGGLAAVVAWAAALALAAVVATERRDVP